jgi:acetyltransferase-like isoleucine patch superfamily enzyme
MLNSFIKLLYTLLFPIYKRVKYPTCKLYTSEIHPHANIGKFVEIRKYSKVDRGVEIGNYTYINEYTRIDANTKSIGRYCSISHNVKIGMGPHPLDYVSTSPVFYSKHRGYVDEDSYDEYEEKGYTEIGDDVFIAANVIVFAGVKVGTGAVIGAGSIVTKDVPAYALVVGSPAKVIRYRFTPFQIDALLKLKWWERENDFLLENHKLMNHIDKFLEKMEKN